MVRIGIVGVGFMGMIHYLAAQRLRGAKVAALCSRDVRKRAGDWRGIRGNFGPAGARMDLGNIKTFASFEEMCADPDIDLIDVCTPTALHPDMARQALRSGKHVLVEKAIALERKDADSMLKEAERASKLFMVAHVLPFVPEFAFALDAVRSGEHGRLLGGHFKRVISRPDWSEDIADARKTGGPAVDLHIHDTHFIALLAGTPERVFATGAADEQGNVSYLTTQYLPRHPEAPVLSCSSGALAMSGRPFVHGFELYLEQATLLFESGVQPLTVLSRHGKKKQPRLAGAGDDIFPFTRELQAAVAGVQAGAAPDLLSGKLARDALLLCQKECQSVLSGSAVAVK